MSDLISRQSAIDATWKALFDYQDRTEKQFMESDELDLSEWFLHRIFVQNVHAEILEKILELPSAQQWIPCSERLPQTGTNVLASYKDNDEHIGVIYGARPYLWEGDTYTPIAWMPLPEPYEEIENEI